jgi:hypothetical protein
MILMMMMMIRMKISYDDHGDDDKDVYIILRRSICRLSRRAMAVTCTPPLTLLLYNTAPASRRLIASSTSLMQARLSTSRWYSKQLNRLT